MLKRALWQALLVLTLGCAQVGPVLAQTPVEDDSDEWVFTLAPMYIWFAGIEGDAGIGPVSAPLDVSFGDVWDNLDTVFTVHFEARKRKWAAFGDYMHMSLSPSATTSFGAPVNISISSDIAEIGGTYLLRDASPSVEALVGARYTDLEVTSNIPPIKVQEDWWDGFVGGRVIHTLGANSQWHLIGRGDVGAGGSDFTWSASAIAAWQFKEWGALHAGYRALGYDYETGSGASRFAWDVVFHGPIAGVIFRWRLVEAAGIEPASASTPPSDLHA